MAYKIYEEACISCGACAAECPVDAIEQSDSAYHIRSSVCTDCGLCEKVCPVDCISKGNAGGRS